MEVGAKLEQRMELIPCSMRCNRNGEVPTQGDPLSTVYSGNSPRTGKQKEEKKCEEFLPACSF